MKEKIKGKGKEEGEERDNREQKIEAGKKRIWEMGKRTI